MHNKKIWLFVVGMSIAIIFQPKTSYAGFLQDLLNNIQIIPANQGQNNQQENGLMATPSNEQTEKLAIGDDYAGGTIFYLDDSEQHGLVATDTDIKGTRSWDEAMSACRKYKKGGYNDWFLPNKDQLAELYLRREVVGGWTPKDGYGFWSSTQSDIKGCAWLQYFNTGNQYRNIQKNYLFYGRCVRAF